MRPLVRDRVDHPAQDRVLRAPWSGRRRSRPSPRRSCFQSRPAATWFSIFSISLSGIAGSRYSPRSTRMRSLRRDDQVVGAFGELEADRREAPGPHVVSPSVVQHARDLLFEDPLDRGPVLLLPCRAAPPARARGRPSCCARSPSPTPAAAASILTRQVGHLAHARPCTRAPGRVPARASAPRRAWRSRRPAFSPDRLDLPRGEVELAAARDRVDHQVLPGSAEVAVARKGDDQDHEEKRQPGPAAHCCGKRNPAAVSAPFALLQKHP